MENVVRKVRRETVWLAGYAGEITARCSPKSPNSSDALTCTSSIKNVVVTWDVTTDDTYWKTVPRSGLILRDAVVEAFYNEHSGAKTVRCNDIPEAVLVPLGKETDYACQAEFEGEPPSAPQRVTSTERGPRLSD
ncbi:hypothetical protein [Streptomyces sp. NPDC058486]|uniref:hypothetical protein n=1 Tax=unclassified Streptomyces TaxID=2593676 RepID=UPI003661F1EA